MEQENVIDGLTSDCLRSKPFEIQRSSCSRYNDALARHFVSKGGRSLIVGICVLTSIWVLLRPLSRGSGRIIPLEWPYFDSQVPAPFNWSKVQPTESILWEDCYEGFECSRLSTPLDYTEPSDSKAAIAIIKLPARVSPDSEKYLGPILFNPGGPGGSGVDSILNSGTHLQTIVGGEFDLIGFDPRGVGRTTPSIAAFRGNNEAGQFFSDYPINVNTSSDALGKAYAYSNMLGDLAKARISQAARFVSTPMVARDMLSIIKALGREKLQYWGFSYGTVLGATFAAMFPVCNFGPFSVMTYGCSLEAAPTIQDKIERLILDGVVDAENYYAGAWSNNLLDTDAALYDLYAQCVEAGPIFCPLYENTVDAVKLHVDKILQLLKTSPVLALNPKDSAASGVVDYEMAKMRVFVTLYRTHSNGTVLLNMLAALESGDGWPIYSTSDKVVYQQMMTCNCPALPGSEVRFGRLYENLLAIACGDSTLEHENLEHLKDVYDEMAGTSSFAETWWVHAMCSGWKIKSKERFMGSFNKTTSHPILLIGNVADPVTPLANARKMSDGFSGSVVLTQNSSGHCSTSATSLCTAQAIQTYFQTGVPPERGAICQVDSTIFGSVNFDSKSTALGEDNVALLWASHHLQETYPVHIL